MPAYAIVDGLVGPKRLVAALASDIVRGHCICATEFGTLQWVEFAHWVLWMLFVSGVFRGVRSCGMGGVDCT